MGGDGGAWVGGELGPVRPYALVRGRVAPSRDLTRHSLVRASTHPPARSLIGHYTHVYALCREGPRSVAEIAARLHTTRQVAAIWLSDLMDDGYVVVPTPREFDPATDPEVLQAVLDGLKRYVRKPAPTGGQQ
jgi:hypothetical protein